MKYEGYENWVSVFDAASLEEAAMIKGMLQTAKIPVELDRDSMGDVFDYTSGIAGDIVVKVPKGMVAKAAQLLQSKRMDTRQEE